MHWGVKKMANVRVHLALRKIRTQNIIPIPKRDRQTALREARAELAQAIDEPVNEPVLDLDFDTISLNDEDITNLAQALQDNRTTTTLTLKNNQDITDHSAEILLKALEKNRTLRTVNFEGTKVNQKVIHDFQSTLDKKCAPHTPGFVTKTWQSILNIFSRFKVTENIENPPVTAPPAVAPAVAKAPAASMAVPASPLSPSIAQLVAELALEGIQIEDQIVTNRDYICPISGAVMTDPVNTADGQTYDRAEIEAWLKHNTTSPVTGKNLDNTILTPNLEIKENILAYLHSLKAKNQNRSSTP